MKLLKWGRSRFYVRAVSHSICHLLGDVFWRALCQWWACSVRLLHIQYALVRARMCAWCNIQMASLSLLSSIPLLLLDIDMPFMRVAIKHKISTPPIFVWLIFEALPLFSDADTFIFSAATHSFNHQKWYKYIFFKMLIPIYICIFGRNEFLISSGIIQLKK
jgi:hypothetical protein